MGIWKLGAAYAVPLHSAAAPKPLGDGSEGEYAQVFDSGEYLQHTMEKSLLPVSKLMLEKSGGNVHFNRVHGTKKRMCAPSMSERCRSGGEECL